MAFRIAPGQAHELPHAIPLLEHLLGVPKWVVGDRGLTSHAFREHIWSYKRSSMPYRRPSRPRDHLANVFQSFTLTRLTIIAAAVAPQPAATSLEEVSRAGLGSVGTGGSSNGPLPGSDSFTVSPPATSAEPTSTSPSRLSPQPSSPGASSNDGFDERSEIRAMLSLLDAAGILIQRTKLLGAPLKARV